MGKVIVRSFGVSLDGFGAGPDQSLEHPLGVRGGEIMGWVFPTAAFKAMHGQGEGGGETGRDDDVAKQAFVNVGAWILGRNMFGPIRGPWPDDAWRGWWGEEPPYKVPVFVLTHFPRAPLAMKGGTVFHFVTDGYESALARAKRAAEGADVRVGGGVSTVRHYLRHGLIDEAHFAVSPVLLGRGENLFQGIDLSALGYRTERTVMGERAMHVFITKS